jgi:3-(methylthio)propanoyl-CoA dehydrogenase
MPGSGFLSDNADLDYYLRTGVDWELLASLTERGFRDPDGFKNGAEAVAFYREVLGTIGDFAAREVAPFTAEIDRQPFRVQDGDVQIPERLAVIFEKLAGLGLHGLNLPRELGGMNAPMLLYFMGNELLARADISVMAHHGFHGGTAMAMFVLSFMEGTTEVEPGTGRVARTRWPQEIAEIAGGRAWGSMDITEPDAGSDMAALRATASEGPEGWTLTGEKIFVTSGHGKYHFVIARTEAGDDARAGLRGLSLFLVPAYRDEPDGRRTRLATIARVEDKLGKHGSATVALSFDRTPAQLIGKRGQGFRLMLEFMNHARLGVGFEAIGLCEAARRMAVAYAAERRSMGKPLERHEMIADYLDEMETDIVGLRALAMDAAFHDEVAYKLELYGSLVASGDTAKRAREHVARARRATPLLKYLAAEKAVEMARRCLQIHGGNGYMKELGAEKLVRDALVLPIYEGTSQIQALMAMKDTLGAIMKAPQDFIKRIAAARWRALSARDSLEARVAVLQQLSLSAQQHLITRTMAAKMTAVRKKPLPSWREELFSQWNPKRDFSFALLHAERLTRMLADVAIAEALLAQSRRDPERRPWLERYLERAEPRARFLLDEVTTTGNRLVAQLADPVGVQEAAE